MQQTLQKLFADPNGYCSMIDQSGRTLWKVDAHRDDGKRYVVTADELLTAFLELQTQIRIVS